MTFNSKKNTLAGILSNASNLVGANWVGINNLQGRYSEKDELCHNRNISNEIYSYIRETCDKELT